MVFTKVRNPRSAVVKNNHFETTLVQQGATIGANTTIVRGNTLGSFAYIRAGSVVTKNIPANALMVGNPTH